MSKTKDIFEEKIKEKEQIHEELLKKEMKNLEDILKSEKYNIDEMMSKTSLGYAYHDLIDSKDKLNSEYQRKYNQTYHTLDVELYKLNKKIENKSKMVNFKYNNKKEKVINRIINQLM
ncbi:MAG: hypothetical protein E7Z85_02110 [Methanosphaera stadtmanae]|nr:hypothetical protein [Methanosphaera stadtmanae]